MTEKDEQPKQVRFMCCLRTMPFKKKLDEEGFLICPEHEARRYGWRSPRQKKNSIRADFSETRLEQDQAIVRELFG